MKLRKKVSLATTLSLAPVAAATALSGCSNNQYVEYHIVTINDLHGAVPGFGENVSIVDKANPGCFRLLKEVNKILHKYPNSVFLSAGDENSGDSWSTCSHAQTTYPILKTMGVRYCAVGNHAFEWGLNDLTTGLYDRLGRTDQTEGKYFVCSNIFSIPGYNDTEKTDWCLDETNPDFESDFNLWNKSRVAWADPYKILKFGNGKVCLIGLATTGTVIDSNRDVTKDLSFVDYKASVHYTKHLIKQELGEEAFNGIDSFILFTHCAGEFNEKKQKLEGEAIELAERMHTDIDAVISAHSHKMFAGTVKNRQSGKDIWVSQAGTAGRAFTDTKLLFNPFEKPGKRLHSISMEVKKVDVTTEEETAKTEWKNYCDANVETLEDLATTYNYEKQWVSNFFSRKLSKVTLTEDQMQKPSEFKGYYNGIKSAIDPFTKSKTIPGHDYWASDKIQDHFGGWIARAFQLGFYYYFRKIIQAGLISMPSIHLLAEDTTPGNLASGDICVREMYDILPYDNKVVVSNLDIFQLANILNYSLAGKPNSDQSKGFKYRTARKYAPDLNTYFADTSSESALESSKHILCNQKSNTSNYVCGPLFEYGLYAEIQPISKAEKSLEYESEVMEEKLPIYDGDVTTYKVATEDVGGVKLPKIKVFEYKYNQATGEDNIADIDNPKSDSWKPASYWYNDGTLRPIPILTNSFTYGGGNDQCKMIKYYQDYNFTQRGWSQMFTASTTIRDVLERFFVTGVDTGIVWEEGRAPINLPWKLFESLIDIKK